MLTALMSWPDFQILESTIQMLQQTSDIVSPDLDSIEYSYENDMPEWMRGTKDVNNQLAFWGLIMTGFGISLQLAAFAFSMVIGRFYYITGFILSFGMAGVYIWAAVAWTDTLEESNELTTYRSWKVNFVAFWVYIGATLLNILCALNW